MYNNINLYEYINRWVSQSSTYPYYKIDLKIDFLYKLISSHKKIDNISILASGSKRNKTDISYMEYLTLYLILDNTDKIFSDTIIFKNSILELIKSNDLYFNKVNESSHGLILEYENEKIILLPSFKNIENNIESVLISNKSEYDEIFYPKLDNKNFDKKERECGSNFINLIKIFKHIFLTFASEIKSLNELSYNIIEALIWNIPNEYFKFRDYDEAVLKAVNYIYEKIGSDDYMSLSEINDIKILFSARNNLHRKEILQALYKIKQIIQENL